MGQPLPGDLAHLSVRVDLNQCDTDHEDEQTEPLHRRQRLAEHDDRENSGRQNFHLICDLQE